MIKINKQVAKSKISCFLEINEVVLFLHCNNSVSLNKNDNSLDLNKIQGTCQTPRDRVTKMSSLSFNDPFAFNVKLGVAELEKNETYKRQVLTNQNTFKSMMVKNRLAKKAFLDLNAGLVRQNSVKSSYKVTPFSQNENLFFKKRECLTASLFQGPTLLLGCSNIKILERGVDACAKHKGLILLGALYEKSIINNSQVKRLIANSNNNQGYIRLFSSMKRPFLRSFSLIRKLLSMRCLFVQQERLICLLKARIQQMPGLS